MVVDVWQVHARVTLSLYQRSVYHVHKEKQCHWLPVVEWSGSQSMLWSQAYENWEFRYAAALWYTQNTCQICSGSRPQFPIDSWYDPRLLDPDLFHPYSLTDLLFIPLKIMYHLQFLKFFMVYLVLATIFISTVKEKKKHELWSHKKKIKAFRYCKHYKHIQLCHKKHRAPTILVCSRPTNNEKNNNGKNKNRYACTSVYYITCISTGLI